MDVLGQSSLLLSVVSLAVGVSILARGVRNRLFMAYFALCLVVCGWSFSFFMAIYRGERDGTAYWFHLLLNVWLAPVGLHFIREFVRVKKGLSEILFRLSWGLTLVLTIALGMDLSRISWVRSFVFFAPALVAAQTLHLIWIDIRISMGAVQVPKPATVGFSSSRRIWIYLGALFVLCSSSMDHVSWAPWLARWFPTAGNVSLTIYLFFIGQGISQQRLLNIRALASRTLVLLLIALTLTGVYSLLFAWIPGKLALFFLNSFFVSFLLVMLLDPLRSAMRYLTYSLLTREHRRLETMVREAQRALTGIVDLEPLFDRVIDKVRRTLEPERAGLFVLRSDQACFREVRRIGEFHHANLELLADHPLVRYAGRLDARGRIPILLAQLLENELDRTTSATEKVRLSALIEGLHGLEGNLLIPLIESDQVLAFVVCSVPAPPESWGGVWGLLPVIYPFFKAAAQTLRSMEIFQKQKEKERLAALGEMAAGLAHEIRNPLGAIKGAAQFLDPSSDRPESRFLRVIVEEVDRLNKVVTQFLEYSRKENRVFEIIDLSVLLERTVDLLIPTLPEGLYLEFCASDSPLRIFGNAVQIHQLFLNLIQNSLQALENRSSNSGERKVSVRLEASEDAVADIRVVVEDNGPGIKKENLEKIFIPFFTTSPQGTGLGLSICQKIVESHSGRIEVVSEEGRYAKFTVSFPRASVGSVQPEPILQPEGGTF